MTDTISRQTEITFLLAADEPETVTDLVRPYVTGELPTYRPVDVAELARRVSDETLVLPLDADPAPPRFAVPTVYAPRSHRARPRRYRGERRRPNPPWAWVVVGAGMLAVGEFIAGLIVLAVAS